jgi:hypothetical protein
MRSRIIRIALTIAAGAAGGGITLALAAHSNAPPVDRDPVSASPPVETMAPALHRSEEVAYVQEAPATVPAGQPPTASSATPPDPPANLNPIEARRRQIAEHRSAVENHYRDPIDRRWARTAERQLRDDLSAWASNLHFDTKAVDCRTTSCVATLTFPSYQAANGSWMHVLTLPYGLDCNREVTLDDPPEDARAFDATVVFDCTEARAKSN